MYELKRKKRITEQIKIGEEVLHIDIDPSKLVMQYNKLKDALGFAQATAASGADADIEAYGKAVIDMIELLMGTENTVKVLAFYEGNFIEMMEEVVPFLNRVIQPKIEAALNDLRKQYKNKYRA